MEPSAISTSTGSPHTWSSRTYSCPSPPCTRPSCSLRKYVSPANSRSKKSISASKTHCTFLISTQFRYVKQTITLSSLESCSFTILINFQGMIAENLSLEQRKRVTIAVELVTDPRLLFLDGTYIKLLFLFFCSTTNVNRRAYLWFGLTGRHEGDGCREACGGDWPCRDLYHPPALPHSFLLLRPLAPLEAWRKNCVLWSHRTGLQYSIRVLLRYRVCYTTSPSFFYFVSLFLLSNITNDQY